MRVQCDVCGQAPAAVLCCADEAALCHACDRRVHRANRLAGKHRRLPLLHPNNCHSDDSSKDAAAPPLCDVCKERRGLVFCVEDRAILCADCDDPIHSANDLTAKHTRFLLVGAKLSTALADEPLPSPGRDSDDVPATACAAEDSSVDASGSNSSSISDYLTNICPGWRVEDLLAAAAAAVPAVSSSPPPRRAPWEQTGRDELQVPPFQDADLFDVVAGGRPPETTPAWRLVEEVPFPAAKANNNKQGHGGVRRWSDVSDSDAFAVPEISPSPPAAKRARPSPASFWCL